MTVTAHTPATLAAAFAAAATGPYQRAMDRTVVLHETEDGTTTRAVLSTRHDKDAKAFRAAVRIERLEPRPGSAFSVTTWIPFEATHNRRLPDIPVTRYSDKALAAADAENVAMLVAEPDWLSRLDLGPYQGTL